MSGHNMLPYLPLSHFLYSWILSHSPAYSLLCHKHKVHHTHIKTHASHILCQERFSGQKLEKTFNKIMRLGHIPVKSSNYKYNVHCFERERLKRVSIACAKK